MALAAGRELSVLIPTWEEREIQHVVYAMRVITSFFMILPV
jgi:hypothetical protein